MVAACTRRKVDMRPKQSKEASSLEILLWFREKKGAERKRSGDDRSDRKRKGNYGGFVRRELWQKESDLVELQ